MNTITLMQIAIILAPRKSTCTNAGHFKNISVQVTSHREAAFPQINIHYHAASLKHPVPGPYEL